MPISMHQLDSLAAHFGFRVEDAREYLGLPTSRSSSACIGSKCKTVSLKSETKSSSKRGKSGYQLFLSMNSAKVTARLKESLKSGEKLVPGSTLRTIGTAWKSLSDSQKESWNRKASS